MTIEEAREYWCRRLERAENYSDEHWDAEERHAHSDYIDAMKYAITALTVCIEHKNPKSNADRIRHMTDEELAAFMVAQAIMGAMSVNGITYDEARKATIEIMESGNSNDDIAEAIEWLRKEAEDAGTDD
jgi:hypothetical protein